MTWLWRNLKTSIRENPMTTADISRSSMVMRLPSIGLSLDQMNAENQFIVVASWPS